MGNSVNVLYISYDGLTDPLGTSQILPYIIGLSKYQYRFTIISAEKPGAYKAGKTEIQRICQENNIDWLPIEYHKKPPVLSTIKDIGRINRISEEQHKQKNFSIVHCRSYISAFTGQRMKKKYGIKFIFDMRGFYPDERVDGKIWNIGSWIYRKIYQFFKKKEKEFLQDADAIVSLTHAGKKIMIDDWGVKKSIYVIPCTVDTNLFKPEPNNSQFRIQNSKLTLGYLGSIGTWYLLDEMLDFFKVLLQKFPEAKFKFITKEKPDTILDKAGTKNIDIKKIEIVSAKREEVPKELSKIDVGIFFIKPVFSKKASSPVKQGEFMAMGIPVITNSGIGDTDEIIKKYKSGILINNFSEEEFRNAIEKIEDLVKMDRFSIAKGASEYFSLKKGIEMYQNVYEENIH